jgi:hypothetical protein
MKCSTRIDFQEYLKLLFVLTYRKWTVRVLSILGIANLFVAMLYYVGIRLIDYPPTSQLLLGLVLTFLFPASIYLTAKKTFSNSRMQELIEYEILPDRFKQRGESFNVEYEFRKSYKLEETKDWFLVYQNKQVANFIPKRCFDDFQIAEIRDIFRDQGGQVIVKLQ